MTLKLEREESILYCGKCGFYTKSYDEKCENCKEGYKSLLKLANLKGGN